MAEGAESVRLLCELAARRGLPVDMHCDESDDPLSRHVESLAAETVRCGLQGRVTGSHLTSMHSMDNYYVSKLIPLMAEARLNVIANPLINITLQGRHDTYPKRRGMTRVPELMAAGLTVAFGHDCVTDPFYPMGSGDMLEVASMGLHVAQMTGMAGMRACFDAVTVNARRAPRPRRLRAGAGLQRRFRGPAGARSGRGDPAARRAAVRRAPRQGHRREPRPDRPAPSAGAARQHQLCTDADGLVGARIVNITACLPIFIHRT